MTALARSDNGREIITAASTTLRARLANNPGPAERSRAYSDHRRTVYVETQREGLDGPDAIYHLKHSAQLISEAAWMLAGTSFESAQTRLRDRPAVALRIVAMAHGWRYVRGVEGLTDALKANGVGVARFLESRAAFEGEFELRATVAHFANDAQGDCPAAVVKVIRMFIEELRELAGWLESPGVFMGVGTAGAIEGSLHGAEVALADYERHVASKRRRD